MIDKSGVNVQIYNDTVGTGVLDCPNKTPQNSVIFE